MVRFLLFTALTFSLAPTRAQKVDSIFFHLYTDSLKKGTHNYINVDGKLSNGSWMPLTAKELLFTSSDCSFSGNDLVIPADFRGEKVTVKATLRNRPDMFIERTIWIKRKEDGPLQGKDEVLREMKQPRRRNR